MKIQHNKNALDYMKITGFSRSVLIKTILLTLLIISICLMWTSPAYACSCRSATVQEHFLDSDAVFIGTVIAAEGLPKIPRGLNIWLVTATKNAWLNRHYLTPSKERFIFMSATPGKV
jgi:hypothetical protein